MEGGPCPLLARRTSSSLRECASLPHELLGRGVFFQGPGVGVLAGLHKIVQVEVACDKRGGLAVRLIQGQRLIPL